MKLRFLKNLITTAGALAVTCAALAQTASPLGNLPLYFEANQGQLPAGAAFLARTADAQCALSASGVVMELRRPAGQPSRLQMNFVGANPSAQIHGVTEQPGRVNYLIGNDPAHWHPSVPTFAQVRVEKIYPGVDVVFYGSNHQLEYDFNFAAGRSPQVVALHFGGAEKIQLDANGDLLVSIGGGEIRQPRPLIYQTINGARHAVSGGYDIVAAQTVAFKVGDYDHSLPLVIDPVLSYSTFLGGNYGDTAWAVAVDANDGSVYVAGQTFSRQVSTNKFFTTTAGAYQTNYHGGVQIGDAFIAKLDPLGTNLIYLTYLGGSGNDAAYGVAVDNAGHAYVCGFTDSTNFPTINAITNGAKIHGVADKKLQLYPSDAIVAELDAGGSNLVYSTYLGAESYEAAYAIALDPAGDAFVTGFTYSTNFPGTKNTFAYQPSLGCTNNGYTYHFNAFVTEIAAGGNNLKYSTYLGGTNADMGKSIAYNNGEVFVAGYTFSTNFPTKNVIPGQKFLNGSTNQFNYSSDAFLTVFKDTSANSATNLTLLYSTLLGGTNSDIANGIAADAAGNAYVVGSTTSTNFPCTNALASFGTNSPSYVHTNTTGYVSATNAFLTQVKWNGTNAYIGYSAMFGGYGNDVATAVALDAATGNPYVAGYASSTNFPVTTNSLLVAANNSRLRATNSGYSDAFVLVFTNDASALLYSTYLGGNDNDFAYAIAVDPAGAAYVVGQTLSTNFPVVNARQTVRNGTNDAFLAKISLAAAPQINLVPHAGAAIRAKARGGANPAGAPEMQLAWRMFPPAYTLESTANFADPNSWAAAPVQPDYSNGWFNVTVPATNASQFFRLRKF